MSKNFDNLKLLTNLSSPRHDSANTHVTGASEYVDDRPMLSNEVFCGVVYSTQPCARIPNLDLSLAEKSKGVVCVVTANDVKHNAWGPIFKDQPIIASSQVNYVGEVLAVIAAQTEELLRIALRKVQIQYEILPAVMTIDDAVQKKSFIGSERQIARGDAGKALNQAKHRLSGVLKIKGADHFYLENQAAVVYPLEGGQLEVHSSTQHPTETQHVVAEACGLPFSDVVCIAKRLGGAFGGKESQAAPIAAYAALIAQKSARPARLVLTKDDDMIITGKRNPFQIHYECGFDDDGTITVLDAMLYSDGGAYADLSTAIMERALLHCDNAYFIENIRVRGQVCKTNHHPHTAFRGFGGPKGVALIESIIEDIARTLGLDALDIRKKNCYRDGFDTTHYGQKLQNNLLPSLFQTLESNCDYRKRRQEITEKNKFSKSHKYGLSMTAVKFGISFTTRFLNQGNALVNVHRDGTIQVSTGAVEMGQGVNQRIAMIVASVFDLPETNVRVMPTSTEKNANTSPTAASSGTDINGAAALKACNLIKDRLSTVALALIDIPKDFWPSKVAGLGTQAEISLTPQQSGHVVFSKGNVLVYTDTSTTQKAADLTLSFRDLAVEAYLSRISLCEYAHYSIENLGFNKLTGHGQAFLYYTQGVASSEVQVNLRTGETKVLRVDILMDIGRPVNAGLDIGQITGGFIQGMGWMTTENLVYNQDGYLLSHSPSTYKIPSVQDTPRVFHVNIVENNENSVNVRGTKATGEPPLLLAISTWTAIRDAIGSVPASEFKPLPIPATNEVTLRALYPNRFAAFETKSEQGL